MSLKHDEKRTFTKPTSFRTISKLNIQTIDHLALQLSTTPEELEKFERNPPFSIGVFVDKKGKQRPKAEPIGRLKVVLKALNSILQRLNFPVQVHGGRTGRSNISNAEPHRRKDVVLKFDISKFFPSISPQRVFEVFHHRCGCHPRVAKLLTKLTTFNSQLPQGSPPSTIIAALVAENLLKRIHKLVRIHGGVVTIYVDDITVSGTANIAKLQPTILKIINQERFRSNASKKEIRFQNEEQIVTGVKVNEQLCPSADRIKRIRDGVRKLERRQLRNEDLPAEELGFLIGQIGYLSNLDRGTAKHYKMRLRHLEAYHQTTHNIAKSPKSGTF